MHEIGGMHHWLWGMDAPAVSVGTRGNHIFFLRLFISVYFAWALHGILESQMRS